MEIINNRFNEYDETLKETELIYNEKSKQVIPYTKDQLNEMSEQEKCDLFEWYAEDYIKLTKDFPKTLRNSFLVGYYSLFEYYLFKICGFAKKHKNIAADVNLIRGKGIIQAKTYLVDVSKIDITTLNSWHGVLKINKIRNSIVHYLCILEKPNGLTQYLSKHKQLIEIDFHKRIIIKDGYLNHASKIIRVFL